MRDETLALACAVVLFALCAWPLLLVVVPPYQDVPNHLAVATIIDHPADYPEFVFNGFLKTNGAFYAWEHFVGHVVGAFASIRLFAALVFAVSARAFTRLVLVAGGRDKMLVATLFLAPMVHNWCVCLGLLDFTLGFAISILLVTAMIEQRRAPSAWRAARIALLSIACWYAHVIPLFLVCVLAFVELVRTFVKSRDELARVFVRCVVPLAPGAALMTWSVLGQLLAHDTTKLGGYASVWLAPWDLVANLWVQWFLAFTPRSASSIVPCVVLAVIAWRRRRERVPFFEPCAFLALAALYAFVPYVFSFWAFANTRVAPFLWMAALVRVPARLPRWLVIALGAATLAYSVSLGVDYVRLDQDREEFVAGIPSVPERARLLPITFESRGASVNTKPLVHMWGYYVNAKETAAPRVFAASRMFGVHHREPPDPQLEEIALERFGNSMRDPRWTCDALAGGGIHVDDCEAIWRDTWRAFFERVGPRFDWLLLWDPEPITLTAIPREYVEVFHRGRLFILHRP
jgi:hypothetical protein